MAAHDIWRRRLGGLGLARHVAAGLAGFCENGIPVEEFTTFAVLGHHAHGESRRWECGAAWRVDLCNREVAERVAYAHTVAAFEVICHAVGIAT